MRNLFDAAPVEEIRARLGRLRPQSASLWGTMSPAQAMAHCAGGFEMALGELRPAMSLSGRFIGWIVKPLALGNDDPIRKNSPTVEEMKILGERDLDAERTRLAGLMDRFVTGGRAACTTHPHAFFGRLTPDEWATLMYKHMDHHLRQFGA